MAIDLEKLRAEVQIATREQRLEIFAKAGMMLRKSLEEDQKACGETKMRAYMCSAEVIEDYDTILAVLKTVKQNDQN